MQGDTRFILVQVNGALRPVWCCCSYIALHEKARVGVTSCERGKFPKSPEEGTSGRKKKKCVCGDGCVMNCVVPCPLSVKAATLSLL